MDGTRIAWASVYFSRMITNHTAGHSVTRYVFNFLSFQHRLCFYFVYTKEI